MEANVKMFPFCDLCLTENNGSKMKNDDLAHPFVLSYFLNLYGISVHFLKTKEYRIEQNTFVNPTFGKFANNSNIKQCKRRKNCKKQTFEYLQLSTRCLISIRVLLHIDECKVFFWINSSLSDFSVAWPWLQCLNVPSLSHPPVSLQCFLLSTVCEY